MRVVQIGALATLMLLTGCLSATTADETEIDASALGSYDNSGTRLIYCDFVMANLPPDDCAFLQKQKDSLVEGMGQLSAPSTMKRGETKTVRFQVAPKPAKSDKQAAGRPQTSPSARPSITTTQIGVRIGRHMAATLEGSSFEILPSGEQDRDLGASTKAIWVWQVKALEGGQQTLYLTITTKALDRHGEPLQLDLFSDATNVTVNVSLWDQSQDALGKITALFGTTQGTLKALAALLVTLSAVIVAWRKLTKRKSEGKNLSGGKSSRGHSAA